MLLRSEFSPVAAEPAVKSSASSCNANVCNEVGCSISTRAYAHRALQYKLALNKGNKQWSKCKHAIALGAVNAAACMLLISYC
jgi:hypothetical protein